MSFNIEICAFSDVLICFRRKERSVFPSALKGDNVKSLLKKHLTEELFNSLKDKKTANGISLYDCINSGVQNLDSSVGVYAGDAECYTLFASLFDKVMF